MTRRTNRWRTPVALAALAGLGYLLLWPVPIDPVAWDPPAAPPLHGGPHAPNERLAAVERLVEGLGEGPEDIALGPDGMLYTGLADGRIVRFVPRDDATVETFANTGGRPLGMEFDAAGHLVVADGRRGLLRFAPDGTKSVLVDTYGGAPLRFADDVDIARDGTIWFSEASRLFEVDETRLTALDARPTGRLFSYDPKTAQTTLRLDELRYANGVSVAPDGSHVLVTETFGYRVRRLWLEGPDAGKDDFLAENLPGFPDNVRHDERGIVWVALVSTRSPALDALLPHPWVRSMTLRLPDFVQPKEPPPFGWVIGLNAAGEVVHDMQDPTGRFGSITSVNAYGPWLYLGSLHEHAVGRIPRP